MGKTDKKCLATVRTLSQVSITFDDKNPVAFLHRVAVVPSFQLFHPICSKRSSTLITLINIDQHWEMIQAVLNYPSCGPDQHLKGWGTQHKKYTFIQIVIWEQEKTIPHSSLGNNVED